LRADSRQKWPCFEDFAKVKTMMQATREVTVGDLRPTPVGDLLLAVNRKGLVAIEWADSEEELLRFLAGGGWRIRRTSRRLQPFAAEVLEYLGGRRTRFDFNIDWSILSPFQREVLRATIRIPYGRTRSYQQLAAHVNRPRAARAVGRVEATNPMPLVIPCHRVLGSDGKLHGYGGGDGLRTKQWLLDMEAATLPREARARHVTLAVRTSKR
jgi:O-6-methylguanine DNA methyltransferase